MAALPTARPATGNTGSTAKGISFSALAGIASLVAGIVLLPLVLATVGPAVYGVWLFLLAAATFLFFLDLGLGIAIIHFLSRSRSGDDDSRPNHVVSTGLAWASAACLLAIAIFLVIANTYSLEAITNVTQYEFSAMVICGTALLVSMALRPMSSVLFGAGFLHLERTNQMFGVALRIIGTIAACSFNWSIIGIVVVETAALMLPTFLSAFQALHMRLVRLHWKFISSTELLKMMSYSLRSFSVSMVGASILQFGTLVIGVLGSPNQVAYFNAAFRIYLSVRQIIGWLTDPFRSVMSRLYVNDRQRASKVLYDLLFVAFLISAIGCLVLLVTLPVLLQLWLGETVPVGEVAAAAGTLLVGLLLNALHIPLIPASDAAGSPGAFLLHQVLWLFAYAGLSFILFPVAGIAGIALAMTIPLPLIEFAYLYTAQRTVALDFELWFKRVVWPVLPVLILGLLAAVIARLNADQLWVIACGVCFVGAGSLTLYLMRSAWSYRSVLSSLRMEA